MTRSNLELYWQECYAITLHGPCVPSNAPVGEEAPDVRGAGGPRAAETGIQQEGRLMRDVKRR
jgi:hypothetical protein